MAKSRSQRKSTTSEVTPERAEEAAQAILADAREHPSTYDSQIAAHDAADLLRAEPQTEAEREALMDETERLMRETPRRLTPEELKTPSTEVAVREVVESVAEHTRPPEAHHEQNGHQEPHPATARGHDERHENKRRTIDAHEVDGVRVSLHDRGNRDGLAVTFDISDASQKPNADTTAALKSKGFRWLGKGAWEKRVGNNPPASRDEGRAGYTEAVEAYKKQRGQTNER